MRFGFCRVWSTIRTYADMSKINRLAWLPELGLSCSKGSPGTVSPFPSPRFTPPGLRSANLADIGAGHRPGPGVDRVINWDGGLSGSPLLRKWIYCLRSSGLAGVAGQVVGDSQAHYTCFS